MMKHSRITATASYAPEKIVTNDDLAMIMETSDEWIFSRTGIKERRIATDENTSDLCVKVAQQLLEDAKLPADQLDFILVATITPDFLTPSTACLVQGKIGAKNAFAFDLTAACSGFVYALSMGDKLIRTGSRRGIVIGAEVFSKVLDWQDRGTAVLFGDAAAGVLLTDEGTKPLITKEALKADGSRGLSLTSGYIPNNNPYRQPEDHFKSEIQMDGRAIFDFATRDVVKAIDELVAEDKEQVDYFLLHQANTRILDKVARKLKVPREKFPQNMDRYGNTSAASVPLLLDELIKKGTLSLGSQQQLVLSGFGGGLTWGSLMLTL